MVFRALWSDQSLNKLHSLDPGFDTRKLNVESGAQQESWTRPHHDPAGITQLSIHKDGGKGLHGRISVRRDFFGGISDRIGVIRASSATRSGQRKGWRKNRLRSQSEAEQKQSLTHPFHEHRILRSSSYKPLAAGAPPQGPFRVSPNGRLLPGRVPLHGIHRPMPPPRLPA